MGLSTYRLQLLGCKFGGAIFGNFVVVGRAKAHLNGLRSPELCFYRDVGEVEVGLMDLTDGPALLLEIKSGS